MNLAIAISRSKTKLIILILLLSVSYNVNAQVRGTQPGELYFSFEWYWNLETSKQYFLIVQSKDSGQHFEPIYAYEYNSGEMPVGWVHADATPNVLYNKAETGLFRSFDNGKNWELLTTPVDYAFFASGSVEGEIYKKSNGALYYSNSYGSNFNEVNVETGGRLDVGTDEGEIYLRYIDTYPELFAEIKISSDFGENFDIYPVDDNIVGFVISGMRPVISRGSITGELYLVTWWEPANYKIYRSTDYGQNFILQYEQADTCYFWDEYYYFTAGRGECEFYIIKGKRLINGYYTRLHIFHSNDCAQTFTEYIHEFDENWTDIKNIKQDNNLSVFNYPNPCNENTVFIVSEYQTYSNPTIDIFNIYGQITKTIPVTRKQTNLNTSALSSGTYLYRLKTNDTYSETGKLIIIK